MKATFQIYFIKTSPETWGGEGEGKEKTKQTIQTKNESKNYSLCWRKRGQPTNTGITETQYKNLRTDKRKHELNWFLLQLIWSTQVQGSTAPTQSSWGSDQAPLIWWRCSYGFYSLSCSSCCAHVQGCLTAAPRQPHSHRLQTLLSLFPFLNPPFHHPCTFWCPPQSPPQINTPPQITSSPQTPNLVFLIPLPG